MVADRTKKDHAEIPEDSPQGTSEAPQHGRRLYGKRYQDIPASGRREIALQLAPAVSAFREETDQEEKTLVIYVPDWILRIYNRVLIRPKSEIIT